MRNHHTIFQSGCTYLYSRQWCIRVPFSSHPQQHLHVVLLSLFWKPSWHLWPGILFWFGLAFTWYVENLFMCLLIFFMSSLENVYSDSSVCFNCVVCFFDVELHKFFVYFGYLLLIGYIVCKYPLSVDSILFCWSFLLLWKSFLFIVPFAFFLFCFSCWGDISEKISLRLMLKHIVYVFC